MQSCPQQHRINSTQTFNVVVAAAAAAAAYCLLLLLAAAAAAAAAVVHVCITYLTLILKTFAIV